MKVKRSHLNIALVVLVAAVLWTVWGLFKPAGSSVAARPNAEQPLLQNEAPRAEGPAVVDPASIPAPPVVDTEQRVASGRDPFLFGNESREKAAVSVSAPAAGPGPSVRSILFSPTRRLAIVDGKIVGVGDAVGVYTVAEIERGAVVFATADGERTRVAVHAAGVPAGITR